MRALASDNKGLIAIETIIAFCGFIMMSAVIVTFINVAALQLRVNHALTQTVKEISFYAYALQAVGAIDLMRGVDALAAGTRGEIDGVIENAFSIWDSIAEVPGSGDIFGSMENAVNQVQGNTGNIIDTVEDWVDDPMGLVRGLMFIGAQEGMQIGLSYLFGNVIAPSFFWRYMGIEGGADGRAYFDAMPTHQSGDGVSNRVSFVWYEAGWYGLSNLRGGIGGGYFRPSGTAFFAGSNADEIVLGIRYYVDLGGFILIPQRFRHAEVVQQVKARAWVGDGTAYKSSVTPPTR
jgi:hypothetical protein